MVFHEKKTKHTLLDKFKKWVKFLNGRKILSRC